jgi:hypothetical protein
MFSISERSAGTSLQQPAPVAVVAGPDGRSGARVAAAVGQPSSVAAQPFLAAARPFAAVVVRLGPVAARASPSAALDAAAAMRGAAARRAGFGAWAPQPAERVLAAPQ